MSAKKALAWMTFWICLAFCFDAGIYLIAGKEKALEFLGGYVIEKSLSMDNLFLFLMVFSSFGIRLKQQRRILNYGIFFAIVLRLVFILFGVTILNKFHGVLYLFGVILIFSGIKMVFRNEESVDFKNSMIIRALCKIMPVTDHLQGEKFFVKRQKIVYATPLFAILLIIEFSDILFAIDSIPAVFSITTDVFIVFTSNIFAILGLRSMYFFLCKLQSKFGYVKYGVAMILTFTGFKLLMLKFDIGFSIEASLAVVSVILLGSVALSLIFSMKSI